MSIKFGKIKENKDDTCTVEVDMDDNTAGFLFRYGLNLSLPKKYKNKIKILPPTKKIIKNIKRIEISDEDFSFFVSVAVNQAIRDYIKREKINGK